MHTVDYHLLSSEFQEQNQRRSSSHKSRSRKVKKDKAESVKDKQKAPSTAVQQRESGYQMEVEDLVDG